MAEENIIERAIVPHNPSTNRVINNNQYNLYAPVADVGKVGMAGFNPAHFKVNEQIVSLDDDFVGLNDRMTTAEGDIDNLENRMDTTEGDISCLKSRVTITEGDISGLKSRVTTTEGDIDTLENRIGDVEDVVVDLQTDKLDRSTTAGFSAYTHNGATQSQTGISQSALNGFIVQRRTGGQITVPATPSNDTDAVSKGYTDAIDNKLATEITTRADADLALSKRIAAQEGLGGFLDAYNFGVANPSQEALTIEALNQIPSIDGDALKIWNGTRITNLYDNNVWQFNHVSTSTPPYEWANIGSAMIAQATNEVLGIVKGSDSIRVNSQGEVYTSVSILGALSVDKETEINKAVSDVNNAISNMEATLGLAPLWDAEGENELLDAEEEYLLSVAHIDANSINGREFYVMSKAEHAALIQAGTYIPDAFYLTF